MPHRGHEHVERPVRARLQERLLLRLRGGGQGRVGVRAAGQAGGGGEALRRGTGVADEDLVPDAVAPAVDVAVPCYPLLLRTTNYGAALKLRSTRRP